MEMNAANVAQHKIFRWEPSFVDKNMDEKSRFGELSTEEIQVERDKDSLLGLRTGAQSTRPRLPPTVLLRLHPAVGRGKD